MIGLMTCWTLGACTNPASHHPPPPSPTPSASHSGKKVPKTPSPRFTADVAGNQLQKLSSTPAGLAKLRTWMNANGLQNEAVELFIRADIYAPQRKKAAAALIP